MLKFFKNVLALSTGLALISSTSLLAMGQSVNITPRSTLGNQVTLRVKVAGQDNIPIEGLKQEDFVVHTTDRKGNPIKIPKDEFTFIAPEQTTPDLAFVVFLVDISGSMKHPDSAGVPKLEGATKAIRKFVEQARSEEIPLKFALIPFGYPGQNECTGKYLSPVNLNNINNEKYSFVDITDDGILNKRFKELSDIQSKLCASTNLLKPLTVGAVHLRQQFKASQENEARLVIILLSDGYDNSSQDRINDINEFLQEEPKVTVHTLGYGESLRNLRDRADCYPNIDDRDLKPQLIADSCELPRPDINQFIKEDSSENHKMINDKAAQCDRQIFAPPFSKETSFTLENVSYYCQLPRPDIKEFIIDEYLLNQVAKATGGIYQISNDADSVAKSLTDFLKTLREYEIKYQQPDADRASEHAVFIEVNAPHRKLNSVVSDKESIRFPTFFFDLKQHKPVVIGTFAIGFFGLLLFVIWSQILKHQAENSLR